MFGIDEIIVERKRNKYAFSSSLDWVNSTLYKLCKNSINLIFCMHKSIYFLRKIYQIIYFVLSYLVLAKFEASLTNM